MRRERESGQQPGYGSIYSKLRYSKAKTGLSHRSSPPTEADDDLRRINIIAEYSDDTGIWTRILIGVIGSFVVAILQG